MSKRPRTCKASELKVKATNKLVNQIIVDEDLKKLFLDFFNLYIRKFDIRMERVATYNCLACLIIAVNIKYLSIKNFNWELLCKLYNLSYKEEIAQNEKFFRKTLFYKDIEFISKKYKNNSKAIGWIQFYNGVSGFYEYLAGLREVYKYKNIKEMSNYKDLLGISNTVTIKNIENEEEKNALRRIIISNYPEGSRYQNIIKIEYNNLPNIHEKRFTNININTSNIICKKIIKEFFKFFSYRGRPTDYIFKCFMYHWGESIGEAKISSTYDFTEELFLKQFNYYKKLEEFFRSNGELNGHKVSFIDILVYIYRYIIDKVKNLESTVYNNTFVDALKNKYYRRIFQEEYKPMFFNRNEMPLDENKICLLPSKYTMNNTNMNNTGIKFINFNKIPKKYIKDVKKFIWQCDTQVNDVLRKIHYIFDLLCERENYFSIPSNVRRMENSNKEFPEMFLYEYKFQMENRYENTNTLKSVYKMLRKYLKFHAVKYNVISYDFDIFSLSGLDKSNGGNPITEKDLNLIYKSFIENEKDYIFNRLYTIVFEIFIYTNLRIGEILNLKKNCIVEKNMTNNDAIISYISKTSNKEIIEKRVDTRIINLLEEAKKITGDVNDKEIVKDYIFIKPVSRKINPYWKRISFGSEFNKIIVELKGQLDKDDYIPYNIRHTFINNAYKIGTKLKYSIPEISAITGNSFTTAVKHYRDYNDIDNYVEATSKVIISNVDINGKIMEKYDCDEKRNVREDLGVCLERRCTFEFAECLICNYFATFPSRIPIFEKFIDHLDNEIEKNDNEYYIDELNLIKKVATKYLAELYKIDTEIR